MFFAFCPGPDGPMLIMLLLIFVGAPLALIVAAIVAFVRWADRQMPRHVEWPSASEDARSALVSDGWNL